MDELHALYKWKKPSPNLEVGQLVLLKDRNDKYQDWKLARILKTHNDDDDGLVRVIDMNTLTGILRRNITIVVTSPVLW